MGAQDLHLHVWPHRPGTATPSPELLEGYCSVAAARGIDRIAVTEHSHRFARITESVLPHWDRPRSGALADATEHVLEVEGGADLDAYVDALRSATPVSALVDRGSSRRDAGTVVPLRSRERKIMANVVWFDIPVADMDRAVAFYGALTGQELTRLPVGDGKETALFASDGGGSAGCLFAAPEDEPSHFGTRVYFDANPSLDAWLARVEPAGGRILVGKAPAGGDHGYFAYIEDSEGNRVGLNAEG